MCPKSHKLTPKEMEEKIAFLEKENAKLKNGLRRIMRCWVRYFMLYNRKHRKSWALRRAVSNSWFKWCAEHFPISLEEIDEFI